MTDTNETLEPLPKSSSEYVRQWESNANNTHALTLVNVSCVVAAGLILTSLLFLPPSYPRTMLIAYQISMFVGLLVPWITARYGKISMADFVHRSSFQFVGFHCYYLYRELQNTPIEASLFSTTMVYGIILTTILGLPISSKKVALTALAYYGMACLALSEHA